MKLSNNFENEISGKVFISEEKIIWKKKEKTLCDIPLNKIKLIGEYTTSGGPVNDDWFLYFMTSIKDEFHIPMYANGMQELLIRLKDYFKPEIELNLQANAVWANRIIYPENLVGKKIWNLEKLKPITIKEKLMSFIFLIDPQKLVLTEYAESVFK